MAGILRPALDHEPGIRSMPARRQLSRDPNLDTFPENLIRLRKQRGWSQIELADKVGIAQSNISDYERAVVRPSLEIFVALVRTLEVTSDELLGFAPPRNTAVKDRRLLQLVSLIESLPRRDREALLRTIRLSVAQGRN